MKKWQEKEKNIFQITDSNSDETLAEGIWVKGAAFLFKELSFKFPKKVTSYPDTGVFVLFAGSAVSNSSFEKANKFIANGRTTRELIFTSRSAASEFATGHAGNAWK